MARLPEVRSGTWNEILCRFWGSLSLGHAAEWVDTIYYTVYKKFISCDGMFRYAVYSITWIIFVCVSLNHKAMDGVITLMAFATLRGNLVWAHEWTWEGLWDLVYLHRNYRKFCNIHPTSQQGHAHLHCLCHVVIKCVGVTHERPEVVL